MKQLKQVTEEFIYRSDKILKRVIDFTTGWVVETFARGRAKFLKGILICQPLRNCFNILYNLIKNNYN